MSTLMLRAERCLNCGGPLPTGSPMRRRYCKPSCRTLAYRVRLRTGVVKKRGTSTVPVWAEGRLPVVATAQAALAGIQRAITSLGEQIAEEEHSVRRVLASLHVKEKRQADLHDLHEQRLRLQAQHDSEIRRIRAEGNTLLEEEKTRAAALQQALDAQQRRTRQLEEALQNAEVDRQRGEDRNIDLEKQLQAALNLQSTIGELMRGPLTPFVERILKHFRETLLRDNPSNVQEIEGKLSRHHEERRLYTWLLVQHQLSTVLDAAGPVSVEQLAAAHQKIIQTFRESAALYPPEMLDWLQRADKGLRILAPIAASELANLREQGTEHKKLTRQIDEKAQELHKTRDQISRLEQATSRQIEEIKDLRQQNGSLQEKLEQHTQSLEKRTSGPLPVVREVAPVDEETARRIVAEALERLEHAFLAKLPAESNDSTSAWFREKRDTLFIVGLATVKELFTRTKDHFTEEELQSGVDRGERALIKRAADATAARELSDWFRQNRVLLSKLALATANAMRRERERRK